MSVYTWSLYVYFESVCMLGVGILGVCIIPSQKLL